MKAKIEIGVRWFFGVIMVVFGLNKFLHFIPTATLDGTAGDLLQIYNESGFIQIIGAFEMAGGLALLIKKFVPVALTLLIAIMFNAVLFHVLYSPAGLVNALGGLGLGIASVYLNKARFSTYLQA